METHNVLLELIEKPEVVIDARVSLMSHDPKMEDAFQFAANLIGMPEHLIAEFADNYSDPYEIFYEASSRGISVTRGHLVLRYADDDFDASTQTSGITPMDLLRLIALRAAYEFAGMCLKNEDYFNDEWMLLLFGRI